MRHKTVWIVGDARHGESAHVVRWLADRAEIRSFYSELPPLIDGALEPDSILFLQSRSGQLSPACLHRWRSRAPFATLVVLEGVFCEGNSRGRKLLHSATRLAWHEWPRRLPTLLGLEQPVFPPKSNPSSLLMAVSTSRRDSFLAIADACASCGFQSVWQAADVPLTATSADLWLCDEWSAVRDNTSEPAILLLSFPRPDDRTKAAELAISDILAKPLRVDDLHAAIAASLGISRIRGRSAAAA